MEDLKNKVSNIIAIIVLIGTTIQGVLDGVPEGSKWYVYVVALAVAAIAWFTGKDANIKAKKL